MKVLILGGGGVIGQKLAQSLALRGELRGKELTKIVLADIVTPAPVSAPFQLKQQRAISPIQPLSQPVSMPIRT